MAILDADKEGFLRSETSLIQTIGRAARNAEGRVIMYADKRTDSMDKAISETERRRKIQDAYNKEHGITPQTIKKAVRELIRISSKADCRNGRVAERSGIYVRRRIAETDCEDYEENEPGGGRTEF